MAKLFQIHGMLLEEAILHLLRYSGYRTVTDRGTDPTLRPGSAGLEVAGRGEWHQIDAIADFVIPQPFANPPRLLVEGKFKDSTAGIEIVRNAVGVLKDVSEYWSPGPRLNGQPRYHYQYAILSSSGFSAPAQRYAVAQDVYLIPFERAGFFQPVIAAIRAVVPREGGGDRRRSVAMGIALSELRTRMRAALTSHGELDGAGIPDNGLIAPLREVVRAIRAIGYSILAVAIGRVPLVLTPAPGVRITELRGTIPVRIYWDERGWFLSRIEGAGTEVPLVSFDVPRALLERYLQQAELTPRRALDLKADALSEITALVTEQQGARLLRFTLDREWIEQVRNALLGD